MRLHKLLFSIIFLFSTFTASACTALKLNYKGDYIIGQNFDWTNKYAFIVINPIGMTHKSGNIAWVSKYGSATIDLANSKKQVDTTMIPGGMNQYGLAASVLYLGDSEFPPHPTKPVLKTAEWIQYFLDNAKTVPEAIELAKKMDIEPTIFHGENIPTHLFIHDAQGNSAIMEYIKGKLVIYTGKNLPIPVLTNTTYSHSLNSLKKYKGFGGKLPLPNGYESQARFVLAANFLKTMPPITSTQQAIAYTFNALGYLIEIPGTESPTVWSAVYDLSHQTLYYRNIDNAQIRYIHLNNFNFSKGQPVKMLLINNDLNGNVERDFS